MSRLPQPAAQTTQMGLQPALSFNRMPTISAPLPEGLIRYSRSPLFDQETVPAALQRNHRTKAGVWARAVVAEGSIEYVLEAMPELPLVVAAGEHVLIEPQVPHRVRVIGPCVFQLEFYRPG